MTNPTVSMVVRRSEIYGAERALEIRVGYSIDELERDPGLPLFDLPFGTGASLLRKLDAVSSELLLEGLQARP